ncbi:prolyl oligopeptidase family serine peptidase [Glaciecola sp. 1036]|uniref:S9 family peptidase n=1 Tax=Alteromonadaceae TaxID=72275 RepID=UPI003D089204
MTFRPLVLCSLLFMSSVQVHAEQSSQNVLDYADIFDLETAANPIFLKDGKSVVYQRNSMDKMRDAPSTSLWKIDINSGRHVPLLNDSPSYSSPRNPVLSPNGDRIAFVANDNMGAQIYTLYLDTGSVTKLTTGSESPSSITWSPDGSAIAFSMFTPVKSQAIFTEMPAAPKGATWAGTAQVVDKTVYRRDGQGYVKDGFNQLYIVPATSGTPRQLTEGNFHHNGALAWHPKKPLIYLSVQRDEDWELNLNQSNIYTVNVDTGEVKEVTSFAGPESAPILTEDGEGLLFDWLNDRKLAYQNSQLMYIDLDSPDEAKSLTPDLDRSIQDVQYNGDDIVFSYLDAGETKLAKVSMRGKITQIDASLGGQSLGRPYTSGQFALSGDGAIVFVSNNNNAPGDLVLIDGRKRKTLTDLNSDVFAHKQTAVIKSLTVKSTVDERNIDAWIAYPPGYTEDSTEQYPLILEIHGGPHAAYGNTFSMEIQLMAAKGYAVVWSNPRGSSSYGEEFGNTIHHNYPSEDYNDLMDVVDVAINAGNIDKDNLFITGGSGGGVLTAWSIGKTNRFNAAVVAKPVINWFSFALTADAYPFFTQYWMPGLPWEQTEHLWKHSPISLVGNVKTPTMLLTGDADYRTPISETEQYYNALRLQKVPAVMVRVPGASHGIAARPSHLIQKVGSIVSWFDRYNTQKKKD